MAETEPNPAEQEQGQETQQQPERPFEKRFLEQTSRFEVATTTPIEAEPDPAEPDAEPEGDADAKADDDEPKVEPVPDWLKAEGADDAADDAEKALDDPSLTAEQKAKIEEIIRKRQERAARKAKEKDDTIKSLEARNAELEAKLAQAPKAEPEPEIKPEDFDSREEYLEAKAEAARRKPVEPDPKKDEKPAPKVPDAVDVAIDGAVAKIRAEADLFKEVSALPTVTREMAAALAAADDPVEAARIMVNNKEAVAAVAGLASWKQQAAMTRLLIERKPKPKEPKRVSEAPEPITPTTPRGSSAGDEDFVAFKARRDREERDRRKRA